MFVEVARNLGIQGIHHTGYESTVAMLKEMGLGLPDENSNENEARNIHRRDRENSV
jgi:hypothetical protein